jgi:hypothetical protein
MYDLAVQGFVDFPRYALALDQRKIARDPLSGMVDGTNKTYYTTYSPLLTSGSLQVYVNGGLVNGTADYNTGEINLSSAPGAQPKATYTFSPLSTTQILQFLTSGFDEMELRWERGWRLTDSLGALATETSDRLNVVDDTGGDPTCGYTTFSQSRVQVAFLMACCEYRYRLTQYASASDSDFAYRSTGGVSIDKSKRPSNFEAMVRMLDERIVRSLRVAQEQFYPTMEHMGGYTSPPMSQEYAANLEWQAESNAMNVRSTLGYQVSFRPF